MSLQLPQPHLPGGLDHRRIHDVNVEEITNHTVGTQLDHMRVGLYQLAVFLGVGLTMASECIEIGATPTLHEALARTYHLKKEAVAGLTVITAVAQSIGMGAIGPLCDRWGRKWPVIICSLLITAAMVSMAMLPQFPVILPECRQAQAVEEPLGPSPMHIVDDKQEDMSIAGHADSDDSQLAFKPQLGGGDDDADDDSRAAPVSDPGNDSSIPADTLECDDTTTLSGYVTYPMHERPLHEKAVLGLLFATRFVGGFAAGGVAAAGVILAVESAPRFFRARLMFAIMFMSSFGYAISTVGLWLFMPGLGTDEKDDWRTFSVWIGTFPALSTPFLIVVCESPYFLGITGAHERLKAVLGYIERTNNCCRRAKRRDKSRGTLRFPMPRVALKTEGNTTCLSLVNNIRCSVGTYWEIFALLACIHWSMSFFKAGHAYMLKDLFRAAEGGPSAAQLMLYASVAPMVGVAIGERALCLGTRAVLFGSTVVAAITMVVTAMPTVRQNAWSLLFLVEMAKVTYGPMTSCVCIMSSEAFPTEVRGSNYAMLGMLHKGGSIMAQTLTIFLRGDRLTWEENTLIWYLLTLAVMALIAGFLSLALPSENVDGNELEDFVGQKSITAAYDPSRHELEMARRQSDGSVFNIWHAESRRSTI